MRQDAIPTPGPRVPLRAGPLLSSETVYGARRGGSCNPKDTRLLTSSATHMKKLEEGPGRVARAVRYAKVAGSIPVQGTYKEQPMTV